MKAGDVIADRFRLQRRAAAGGMGTVFRAVDESTGTLVAVKTFGATDESGRALGRQAARAEERFQREAQALALVSHPGIVRYVDHGESALGEPYLVMQWVEGQDLAARLIERGLSLRETLLLGLGLTRALGALHSHGVVHRDVKPANVMLEDGDVNRAVLVDLGVARRAELGSATQSGAHVGTPSYMAPEQIRDPRSVDGRADVFSLGCILFECLSGRRAFDAEDALGAIAMILLERARPLSSVREGLPPNLCDLVLALQQRERDERPFADTALEQLFENLLAETAPDLPAPARARGTVAPITSTEVFGTELQVLEKAPVSARPSEPRARVPRPQFELVGRSRELSDLASFLASGAKIVSVWGPAGIGKTRLVLELWESPSASPRWFVELGSARGKDDAFRMLAQYAAVQVRGSESAESALSRTLSAAGPLMLVLDGLDPVAEDIVPWLEELSQRAPELRFVTTSRVRLKLRAAVMLELPALPARAGRALLTTAEFARSPATDLFLQRVRALSPGFAVDERALSLIEGIVVALDGIPLAIELAAAQVPLLGLDAVAETLARPEGRASVGVSMSEAIEASVSRLSPDERELLGACSVFAGRFGPGAAQALASELPAHAVLSCLARLREKSLLSAADGKFYLLSPVREYARAELVRRAAEERVRERHARYLAARVHDVLRERERGGSRGTLTELELEADDLLAAIDYSLSSSIPSSDFPIDALLALEPLVVARGPLPAFTSVIERALSAVDEGRIQAAPARLASVFLMRGRFATTQGRFQPALRDLERALSLSREASDAILEGLVWLELGVNHHFQRQLGDARSCYERALAHAALPQKGSVLGRCYGNLGAVLHDEGRLTEAAAHYWKAIGLLEESGEPRLLANFLSNLAVLEQELGAKAEARRRYERAVALLNELGETRLRAITLGNLGSLEAECGDFNRARRCHELALDLLASQGDARSEALCRARLGAALCLLGLTQAADEQLGRARRLVSDSDPGSIAAVRLQRAFWDLSKSREALEHAEPAEAERRLALVQTLCDEVCNADVDGRPLPDTSDDVRSTLRILTPLLREARQRLHLRASLDG